MITHISRLCQEIRDIKRQNKNQSNSISKAKPREGKTLSRVQEEKAMDSNQYQNRTSIDGTDGSGCTCSSHSTPPPRSEHNHDIPSRHETSHPPLTGGRGGITQGVSFEFFESFLSIYSHNTHWVNFEFFQKSLTTLIKTYSQGNFRN